MDNAMVKRGIGAVVLAIIAALLLGWLLKDKSQDRQDIVEMEIPSVSDMKIPSLSEVSDSVTDSAATIVDETKATVSDASSAVVATATGISNSASNAVESATDSLSSTAASATQKVENTVASVTNSNTENPGFSFRPPTKNEEQQINTDTSINAIPASATSKTSGNSNEVVASAPKAKAKAEKTFKPRIEKETKKVAKKVEKKKTEKKKQVAKKQAATPKPKTTKPKVTNTAAASSAGGKYSIQLLATSSQSRANKLAKTMTGEGYVSYITQTTSNNKVLYRVRVGGHNDRQAAITAQETMKRRYQKNFFVQNSLVVSK